jgi:hypothetical protein
MTSSKVDTLAADDSVLICCGGSNFERCHATGNEWSIVRYLDQCYWDCCVPFPGDPARHLTVCTSSSTSPYEPLLTVWEIRTKDATLIRKFPPCEGMKVASIHGAWRAAQGTAVLLVVHESREMTVLDGTTWEPIAQGPAPPPCGARDMDVDEPFAVLDWSGEWAGIHVYCSEHTLAFAAWRIGSVPSKWVVGDEAPVAFPEPVFVDCIAPVPNVAAAWLIGIDRMLVYARVDPERGVPVCDVVRGTLDDCELYARTVCQAICPVPGTHATVLLKYQYVPEWRGGCDNYVVTWVLPDIITRDQGRRIVASADAEKEVE